MEKLKWNIVDKLKERKRQKVIEMQWRRAEEFKRIESSQTAGLRLSNESFEEAGTAI